LLASYWEIFLPFKRVSYFQTVYSSYIVSASLSVDILACDSFGHSYPTHSYFLHKEPQPLCIPCHSPFSIVHILTECIDFQPIRVKYYPTSDIYQLFHKVHPSSILQCMKDICLYNKLELIMALNSLFVLKLPLNPNKPSCMWQFVPDKDATFAV